MKKLIITGPEKRTFAIRAVDGDDDDMVLEGYAASYNTLSQDLGGFREMIAPGAFKRSLEAGDDVKCLFNHDPSRILGRRSAGTLTLTDTKLGLCFRCQLDPNNTDHRNIHASIKRGDIDQCSFAFQVPDGGDDWDEETDSAGKKFIKRTLRNVTLMDVSAVTYPAYNATGATAVSARSTETLDQLRARVAGMPEEWARHERLHELELQLIREKYATK
jgi:uncharacterized protein